MSLTWLPSTALIAAKHYAALFQCDKLFLTGPGPAERIALVLRPEIALSEIAWRVLRYEYTPFRIDFDSGVYLYESIKRSEASAYIRSQAARFVAEGLCLEEGAEAAKAYRLAQWSLLKEGHEALMKEFCTFPCFGRFYAQAYDRLLSQARIERVPLPREVAYLLTVTGLSLNAPDGSTEGLRLRERLPNEAALQQCCSDVRSLVHALGGLCSLR